MKVADAEAKLDAGDILIQDYTGLIYKGPGLMREILRGLSAYGVKNSNLQVFFSGLLIVEDIPTT
jgi:dihydroorotate dehydrogenase